jgi:hypothetical protein
MNHLAKLVKQTKLKIIFGNNKIVTILPLT